MTAASFFPRNRKQDIPQLRRHAILFLTKVSAHSMSESSILGMRLNHRSIRDIADWSV